MNRRITVLSELALLALIVGACAPTPENEPYPGMVLIPEGQFSRGSVGGDDDQQPVRDVHLESFYIDRYEVTNGQYQECVKARVCDPPRDTSSQTRDSYYGDPLYENYPAIWVSWYDARTYCRWAEKRLPTEAEWEKAARGRRGRTYPWGDDWDGTRLNYCDVNCPFDHGDAEVDDGYEDTSPVGSYSPRGDSSYGVADMAGNVWEWVADRYDDDYYRWGRADNPPGPASGEYRVLRGGSWLNTRGYVRSAVRGAYIPGSVYGNVGFRCARSLP